MYDKSLFKSLFLGVGKVSFYCYKVIIYIVYYYS